MNSLTIVSAMALVIGLTAVEANAEKRKMPKRDIDRTETFSGPRGSGTKTFEQRITDNGFTRSKRIELDDGRTATRDLVVSRDKEAGVRTKEVTGKRLDGSTYSGSSIRTKTDTGFTKAKTRTNAAGQTATKDVVATIDRDAGVMTKEITRVNFEGETSNKTIEVELAGREQ